MDGMPLCDTARRQRKIGLTDLRAMKKRGERVAWLTAYDRPDCSILPGLDSGGASGQDVIMMSAVRVPGVVFAFTSSQGAGRGNA